MVLCERRHGSVSTGRSLLRCSQQLKHYLCERAGVAPIVLAVVRGLRTRRQLYCVHNRIHHIYGEHSGSNGSCRYGTLTAPSVGVQLPHRHPAIIPAPTSSLPAAIANLPASMAGSSVGTTVSTDLRPHVSLELVSWARNRQSECSRQNVSALFHPLLQLLVRGLPLSIILF